MNDDNSVRIERHGAVAVLTLDSPGSRNAFTPPVKQGVMRAMAELTADREVRALVITGAGGHFCAGGDVRGMAAAPQRSGAELRERMLEMHRMMRDIILFDRPVVAAVDGAAYGAGFSLALAADFVIASNRARFCSPFLKLGLVPDCGITYTLPRAVGHQRAQELMLSAREVPAQEAREIGIVAELHEPDRLLPRAIEIATSFASASPVALGLLKRHLADTGALDRALDGEATMQALCGTTPGHREAVQRFVDKQAPAFQWPAAKP